MAFMTHTLTLNVLSFLINNGVGYIKTSNNITRAAKKSQVYSLPFGQAVASMY